jgi:hypothetical protein
LHADGLTRHVHTGLDGTKTVTLHPVPGTDLATLCALLDRAGRHRAEQLFWRDDDHAYAIEPMPWDESLRKYRPDCEDCVTQLRIEGQWTGELEAHFTTDGTIRHLWVSGD